MDWRIRQVLAPLEVWAQLAECPEVRGVACPEVAGRVVPPVGELDVPVLEGWLGR